jgi:hypothetical protein
MVRALATLCCQQLANANLEPASEVSRRSRVGGIIIFLFQIQEFDKVSRSRSPNAMATVRVAFRQPAHRETLAMR